MKLSNRFIIILFLITDLILLLISFISVALLHYHEWWPDYDVIFYLLNVEWILTYILFLDQGFFDINNFGERLKVLVRKFFVYISLGAITIVTLNFDDISRAMFLGSSLLFFVLKIPAAYVYTYIVTTRQDAPFYNKILIVGADKVGQAIYKYFSMNPSLGKVIGFLDDRRPKSEKNKILGSFSDFQNVFNELGFNEIIITIDLAKEQTIKSLINLAEYNGVRPSVVANYYSIFNRNFELKNFGGIPMVNIREVPLDYYIPRFWKRMFDVGFSSFALLMLSPVLILIAVAIKLDSRGPVFYKPIRIGKRGAQIKIFKFRSMRHNINDDKTRSTKMNDERITKVGKFIRKYSLDELPQFINVLIGEMSIIGPRPHRIDLDKRFQQLVPSYMVRQYIKPGITGWAQVNGWRGPTETKYQYIARTLHDLWYIEHWNFALDIYIILLTLFGKKTSRNAF